MAVMKEYLCRAHGPFESSDQNPRCRVGCNAVERVFLTAPSVRTSPKMKNIDNTLDSLAQQFGLGDLSTRNGSVMSSIKESSKPDHIRASYNALYGDPRTEMLRPRFENPSNLGGMLSGTANTAALAMRDQNNVGLGDALHNRMGQNNIDPQMVSITGKTSADDNAKLQAALEQKAA